MTTYDDKTATVNTDSLGELCRLMDYCHRQGYNLVQMGYNHNTARWWAVMELP